jgi:hypothetical protein
MKKDITFVAIDFIWHDLTRYATEQSLKHIDPKEIVIISDREILPGAKHIIREPVSGMQEYNEIMLKGITEHVNTKHAMYIQWDGIANDREQWRDEFLDYDYIGAVWPWETEGKNVGNGGFSLRSKRLLDACMDDKIKLSEARDFIGEDGSIGVDHRPYLETEYGIKYATTEIARKFSYELGVHEPSFGFHGLWNVFNLMTDADMDYFYTRIDYKGWNGYKWHHTLAAVIRRNRMDIYEYMLGKLIEHSPELLQFVGSWLERDAQTPKTELVID